MLLLKLSQIPYDKMAANYEIDNVDLKILEVLMKNAKKPYTEVAKQVYVSGGTVHVRMK